MAGSYRSINYSLRPSKAIERRMLCEAFRRIHHFGKIEDYRYVGFGSIYFSDFSLFHRTLGIDDMVSIEQDVYARDCFEFNRPYGCIQMDFRHSSESLPNLDWATRTIVWLDYDGKLEESMLEDVATVCTKACSGSLMIISVNADSERDPNEEGREGFESETGTPFSLDEYRLRLFRTHLLDRVPPDVTGADLRGRGVASVSRRILQNAIDEVLSTRNQILPAEERINYRQLFNFQYSDGALILTVGGIFFKEADRSKFDACSFGSLDFIKTGEGPLVIKAPCLTLKELRSLNSQLPAAEADIQIPKLFSAGDVLDAPALIQRFRNASDPVSTFLWNAFSAEAQTRLTSGELNSEEAHTSIANELNRLLRDPGVYDEERFTGIEISDVTRELLQQNPEGDTLIRVNRKLLECAYPYELKRTGPLVPGVPPSQIEQYAKIYRYFPTFAEAILS